MRESLLNQANTLAKVLRSEGTESVQELLRLAFLMGACANEQRWFNGIPPKKDYDWVLVAEKEKDGFVGLPKIGEHRNDGFWHTEDSDDMGVRYGSSYEEVTGSKVIGWSPLPPRITLGNPIRYDKDVNAIYLPVINKYMALEDVSSERVTYDTAMEACKEGWTLPTLTDCYFLATFREEINEVLREVGKPLTGWYWTSFVDTLVENDGNTLWYAVFDIDRNRWDKIEGGRQKTEARLFKSIGE